MSGCSSSKTATSPVCEPAHAAQYPRTDAALADSDSGGTFCATVGETLSVTLHVPLGQSGPRWEPITGSDPGVLEPVRNGAGTIPANATAAFFSVREPGTVADLGTSCRHAHMEGKRRRPRQMSARVAGSPFDE